ncbi:MAG TPA: response regulator transcription factor [Candidatus Cottocaccamicrobium excrementipullorum]|nr:response regulator transcription factor [Candidatus Cottocaccamicrobium excrementipullorum]
MKINEARILVADDHQELCAMVRSICLREGFLHVDSVCSCREAEERILGEKADFLILDVNMPYEDGFSFFQRMKNELQRQNVPVLFLSARDQDEDRLLGLGLGADDYMTKPFLPRELVLRIQAILRRTWRLEEEKQVYVLGNRQADLSAGVVQMLDGSGKRIPLTNKEFKLLKLFLENPGRILTFDYLSEAVWGENYYDYENTLMVHIRRLREKIEEEPSAPRHLITVKGLGYRMDL